MAEQNLEKANQEITKLEFNPVAIVDEMLSLDTAQKLPIAEISALGMNFAPLANCISMALNGGEFTGGICRVTPPAGTHLAYSADKGAFIGTGVNETGIVGQSSISPLAVDPAMLAAAAAVIAISQKLDQIDEGIQDIKLAQKIEKEAQMEADYDTMADIIKEYKNHWNDATTAIANLQMLKTIKNREDKFAKYYSKEIKNHLAKASGVHSDADTKKILNKVHDSFTKYRMANYLYAFSTFMETVIGENYEYDYLHDKIDKILDIKNKQEALYTTCMNKLYNYAIASVESKAMKTAAAQLRKGKVGKVPAADKLEAKAVKQAEKAMQKFVANKNDRSTSMFTDKLEKVCVLYNRPVEVLMDKENLYLKEA